MQKLTKLWICLVISYLSLGTSCTQPDRMDAYPPITDIGKMVAFPPVILVGRILACKAIGSPRPSTWDETTPYQQYRTTVAVENTLRGSLKSQTVEIYFLKNLLGGGLKQLGTSQYGGHWKIGDREMFLLQRDAGRLRTICDTWAHCVVPVLTGYHKSLPSHLDAGELMAYVLFTRGSGASDAQMIEGLEHAMSIGFEFAPKYSMRKLEELVQTETPAVRQAACHHLDLASRSAPYENHNLAKMLADDSEFRKARQACLEKRDNSNGERK